METSSSTKRAEPWNKGKLVGQKSPFRLRDIWAIRVRLQIQGRTRDLALFNLGIDSKLRVCDLVKLRVRDVCSGDRVAAGNKRCLPTSAVHRSAIDGFHHLRGVARTLNCLGGGTTLPAR